MPAEISAVLFGEPLRESNTSLGIIWCNVGALVGNAAQVPELARIFVPLAASVANSPVSSAWFGVRGSVVSFFLRHGQTFVLEHRHNPCLRLG